jgi:hypothetical protein
MSAPASLIIVQRYHRDLYERLRAQRGPGVDVIIDRRRDERRQGGPYAGVERRAGQRRRSPTPEERALWSELRHFLVTRRAETGAGALHGRGDPANSASMTGS